MFNNLRDEILSNSSQLWYNFNRKQKEVFANDYSKNEVLTCLLNYKHTNYLIHGPMSTLSFSFTHKQIQN